MKELLQKAVEALKAMREACMKQPTMQGREFVSLGIQTNNAISALESALQQQEVPAALTDAAIEAAWRSCETEPDGGNLAGGTNLEGWTRAIRWAEQQHGIAGVTEVPRG